MKNLYQTDSLKWPEANSPRNKDFSVRSLCRLSTKKTYLQELPSMEIFGTNVLPKQKKAIAIIKTDALSMRKPCKSKKRRNAS